MALELDRGHGATRGGSLPTRLAPGGSPGPKLLDRVRRHLRIKRYSIRTEQAYLDWIRRYIGFHEKRHPADVGEAETAAFLSNLAVDGRVAAPTQSSPRKRCEMDGQAGEGSR